MTRLFVQFVYLSKFKCIWLVNQDNILIMGQSHANDDDLIYG